ncbi:MAG: phosphatase PAP2 family protein [Solirubrobacterales bacterium]
MPPPLERGRRLRRWAEAQRTPLGPLALTIGRFDQAALVALRTHGHSGVVERIARSLGTFGEFGVGWAALGVVGAGLDSGRRPRFLAAAAAAPAAIAINFAIKSAIGRERPVIAGHPPLGPAPNKLSFPSAHATSATAGAVALGRVAPGSRPILRGLAALVCIGRPYLGMHYPSDVLAGVGIGFAIGRLWPLPPASKPRPASPPAAPTEPEEER